jgi:hypothetical protein
MTHTDIFKIGAELGHGDPRVDEAPVYAHAFQYLIDPDVPHTAAVEKAVIWAIGRFMYLRQLTQWELVAAEINKLFYKKQTEKNDVKFMGLLNNRMYCEMGVRLKAIRLWASEVPPVYEKELDDLLDIMIYGFAYLGLLRDILLQGAENSHN